VSSTDHKAPYYVVFSTLLLPGPYILLSALFSNILSVCFLSLWETKFHTCTK